MVLAAFYCTPALGVRDPHHFNADPDPAFHFNADPDSDPALHFNSNPEPAPHQSNGNSATTALQPLQGSN
jgi:hypothetical protein